MFAGRPFPRRAAAAIAAALVLTVVATLDGRGDGASRSAARSPRLRPEPSIAPFQGLGVWVDIYDKRAWEDPEAAVADMSAHGVRTLYLETSNFSRRFPFVHKPGVTRFVDAAHDAGLLVVAWYLPGFENLRRDTRRSRAAIGFTTPAGNRFDGFGLDIESSEVENPRMRTRLLLELSHRLRAFAGPRYPLGAIVVSPRRLVVQPDFWPGFPYAELAELYDAFLPMSYFTYSYPAAWRTRRYIHQQVAIIRREVGDDRVPIHVIGGIARDSTTAATRAFVRALRERGVVGGSFYDWPGIGAGEWDSLAEMPSNGI